MTSEMHGRYIMAGKPPSKGTPADQRIKGRGQKPGPKPGKAGKGSKGK